MKYQYLKRLIDLLLSSIIFIMLFPLFLIIAISLKIFNKGAGVFFLQDRPGKDEKIFKVIMSKTLNDKRGDNGNLLPDSERLRTVS